MSVALYLDHHVPAGVCDGLRNRGVDVLTAFEDGHANVDDEKVLERATQLGRLLYTQDKGFLRIAHQWMNAGREFAGLAYAHQMSITIGEAVEHLGCWQQLATPPKFTTACSSCRIRHTPDTCSKP